MTFALLTASDKYTPDKSGIWTMSRSSQPTFAMSQDLTTWLPMPYHVMQCIHFTVHSHQQLTFKCWQMRRQKIQRSMPYRVPPQPPSVSRLCPSQDLHQPSSATQAQERPVHLYITLTSRGSSNSAVDQGEICLARDEERYQGMDMNLSTLSEVQGPTTHCIALRCLQNPRCPF